MPTVAAITSAAWAASCSQPISAIITDISAMLNKSGENAVSAKRACAFNSAIITVVGPAKARYGNIRRASSTASCRVSCPAKPGARAVMTKGIKRPITPAATISAALTVPSTRPENAAAAIRAFRLAHAQPGRYQRRVQCALRQQPPHDIDELKRHQKCVRDGTRTEQRRDHGVARESQ